MTLKDRQIRLFHELMYQVRVKDAMTGDGSGRLAGAYDALLISGKLPSHGILTRNRDATIKLRDKILQAQSALPFGRSLVRVLVLGKSPATGFVTAPNDHLHLPQHGIRARFARSE